MRWLYSLPPFCRALFLWYSNYSSLRVWVYESQHNKSGCGRCRCVSLRVSIVSVSISRRRVLYSKRAASDARGSTGWQRHGPGVRRSPAPFAKAWLLQPDQPGSCILTLVRQVEEVRACSHLGQSKKGGQRPSQPASRINGNASLLLLPHLLLFSSAQGLRAPM